MSAQNAFQEKPCVVIVRNNFDTAGSVTRATINELTPTELIDVFKPGGKFGDMDSWFRTSFEMKACGTKTNGLYEWLMSSRRDMSSLLNVEKLDRGPSLLKPFVLGRQESIINKDFWAISGGQANSAYTASVTGPLTAGDLALGSASDRVIRVITRYGIDLDAKWFLSRDTINIFGRASGTGTLGQWKVLASEVATDLSYIDVLVTSQNSGSTIPFDAAPTAGVVLAGGNNVNDFETWCGNRPTLDPRRMVPYWYKTMRKARKVDSEYMKVFARLMESNEYFRQFGDLPLAERNRQDEELYQRQWVTDFFFGKPISSNQTLANWQNLEQITTVTGATVDPGLGGKLVAYRANMVGVYPQMQACGRVKDLQNSTLNFYEFLDEIYRIVRARKSQGKSGNSIDVWTDSMTAANMETAFVKYYKQEYQDMVKINITAGENETLGFQWRSFTVKYPMGVTINLITHEFFDDIANAFSTESIASRGRFLLILEMGTPGPKGGTIYPGLLGTNRKKRTLGELENLAKIDATFACTMEHVTEDIMLYSETVTAVVECPANSLWIENFDENVPLLTGRTADYTNLY